MSTVNSLLFDEDSSFAEDNRSNETTTPAINIPERVFTFLQFSIKLLHLIDGYVSYSTALLLIVGMMTVIVVTLSLCCITLVAVRHYTRMAGKKRIQACREAIEKQRARLRSRVPAMSELFYGLNKYCFL